MKKREEPQEVLLARAREARGEGLCCSLLVPQERFRRPGKRRGCEDGGWSLGSRSYACLKRQRRVRDGMRRCGGNADAGFGRSLASARRRRRRPTRSARARACAAPSHFCLRALPPPLSPATPPLSSPASQLVQYTHTRPRATLFPSSTENLPSISLTTPVVRSQKTRAKMPVYATAALIYRII